MENENQLVVIVQQSGLEETKANFILEKFQDYFKLAAEWEAKAKTIIVTDESQKADMAMARVGRLFLREKRLAIEKSRKELKEQSIREGKAIEGIANVLKALIVPIEEYLDKQERFVEYKKAEADRLAIIEAERKAEEERIAKERAEAEERERIRIENERLKKEAEAMAVQVAKERAEAEAKLKAEREAAEKKQRETEAAALAEKKKQDAIIAAEKAKAEAERKAAAERERIAAEKAASEKAKLEAELKAKAEAERKAVAAKKEMEERMKNMITCPKCGHEFSTERK